MLLYPRRQSLTGKMHDAKTRAFRAGAACLLADCDPNLTRRLCGQAMKLQRREQTDDGVWHPRRSFRELVMFRKVSIRADVEPAAESAEGALAHQAREVRPRNAVLVKIAGTED